MFGPQFSRWFTVSTVAALGVAIGVIIDDHREQQAPVAAAVSSDTDQQRRLSKLEGDLAMQSMRRTGDSSGGDMESRLAALQAEMGKLQETLGRVGGVQAQTAQKRPDPAELDRADQEHTQQLAASLEDAMSSETVDATWSQSAAAELAGNVTAPKTRIAEVRCAATLCRIDATHESSEAEQMFFMQLTQISTFQNTESFMQHQKRADGSLATVMYITRAGHPLPGKSPS